MPLADFAVDFRRFLCHLLLFCYAALLIFRHFDAMADCFTPAAMLSPRFSSLITLSFAADLLFARCLLDTLLICHERCDSRSALCHAFTPCMPPIC